MKELIDFFLRNWVLIVILWNLLVAASNVISKIVLSGSISKPLKPTPYAFYTGIGSIIFFIPALIFNFWFNFLNFGFWNIALGLTAGIFFIFGLWLLYFVLERNEASRVMTVFVGTIPLSTFIIKYGIGERLGSQQIWGFLLLVLSGILISMKHHKGGGMAFGQLVLTILGGLSTALGLVFLDVSFKLQGFLSGFTWLVGGYFLAAMILFLLPGQKKKILATEEYATKKNTAWFFAEKLFSVSGNALTKSAIYLVKTATLVNAFEGLKQFFVLIIASFLSFKYPEVLKEEVEGIVLWQKIVAALLVFMGILLLIYG